MGRRSRRDADYFPFFVKEGRTLTVLQQNHGLAGIGFFTNLMRMLTAKPGHYISIKDRSDRLYLFARLGIDEISGLEMLQTTVETGKIHRLLIETYEVIYCPDLVDSLSELYSHRTVKPFTVDEIISTLETGVSTVDNAMASGFPTTSNAKGEESRGENRRVKKSERPSQRSHTVPDLQFPDPDSEDAPFANPPGNGYDSRFGLARDAWNATGLGDERRLLINCAEVIPIKAVLDMYSDEEILTAVENYQTALPSIEKSYQYQSFVGFLLKGVHNHHKKPGAIPPAIPNPHCPECKTEMTAAGNYCDSCGWHP